MATLVVAGAMLKCTGSSAPSALQIQGSRSVNAGARAVATITDTGTFNFGQCSLKGVPGPCTPSFPAPWVSGSSSVLAGGKPVLTTASQCHCTVGGVVSVQSPGQSSTLAG